MHNVQNSRDGSFGSDRLSRLSNVIDVEDGAGEDGGIVAPLLLPHPDDDTDGDDYADFYSPRLLGGSEYVQQNLYMAAWLLVLVLGWIVQRSACLFGLPKDCLGKISFLEIFSDLTSLFFFGLALGWLVGINESIRFRWLFSKRRWYFWVVYLCTPPVYSLISNIDLLKFSLTTDEEWVPLYTVVSIVAALALGSTVGWHVVSAWERGSAADFWTYVGLRFAVFAWFGTAALVVSRDPEVNVHLHHLYLGWALALWAEFNQPFSGITLAIGSGIFVQGVAAYSFAPVFSGDGCFTTPASEEIDCRFWSKNAFTLRVCPAEGTSPSYSCNS